MFAGIDPSLRHTAIVWINGEVKFHHIINTSAAKGWRNEILRVRDIREELTTVFYPEMVSHIQCIVVEGYSYGSRFYAHQLGELGYVIRNYLLSLFGSLVYVVPPKTITKFITGNGNRSKKDVARELISLGYNLPTEHHYDACAAALFGQGIVRRKGLNKSQLAVMEKYLGRLK